MPASWPLLAARLTGSKNTEVRTRAIALAATFGDTSACRRMREILADVGADVAVRESTLASLVAAKDKELAPVLHKLLADAALRGAALKGLASYDDPRTPPLILAVYAKLNQAEKRDALTTLASRPVYARAMIDAVADKKIAAPDVSADIVRNLRNLKAAALIARIAAGWGVRRDT